MEKVRVLVTGADGQLGKTISELYQQHTSNIDFVFYPKSMLDITKKEAINLVFKKEKITHCINCAAYTNVEQSEKSPEVAYLINSIAVKNLATICNSNNIVLIHISTDYVFDGEKIGAYTVNDKPNPINIYGKSKLLGENHIQSICNKYFIIRTSWLYSKKYGKNFYKTILNKAKSSEMLRVTDEQLGCPTNTTNLAKFIFNIVNTTNYGLYHFCDGNIGTWYDFAKSILDENKLLDKIKLVKTNNFVTFVRRPKNSVLQINKLR